MKYQTTTLSLLAALNLVSSEKEPTTTRRLRKNSGAKLSKSDTSNAGFDRSLQSVFFPPPEGAEATEPAEPTEPSVPARPAMKNVVMLLIDDISGDRFPESGNSALKGKLPGLQELKEDGAVYYPHFHSSAPICAPAQSGMFSGFDPGSLGTHQQFSHDHRPGKANYATVPPPDVMFIPEYMRNKGYYATGGGKLDYQTGVLMPTFFNKILGGTYTDINSYMEESWTPAIELGMPFFAMLNMMDDHEFLSAMIRENPIPLTDSITGEFPTDTPFGKFGWATDKSLNFRVEVGKEPEFRRVPATDVLNVDITGYNGDFDPTTLTHANKGLPSFVSEEIGMQSIWAREYDLIRNVDWRIQQITRRLKEEGVYDDTAIFIFGDHGSASFKGKSMLQLQSVNPPLWVKLPKDVPVSKHVVKGADGFNEDPRLTPMKDAYPTLLSILGIPPEPYNEGRAVAGEYEDDGPEPQAIFSMLARQGGVVAWKSFAAYNKDFYYQRHKLTLDVIEAREALNIDPPEVIAKAYSDMVYAQRYAGFGTSPSFDRARRMMYINAENPDYASGMKYITADEATPPAEVLYDLRSDPYGTENLLYTYTYTSTYGATMQTWGNFVTKITLEYSEMTLSNLDEVQLENYNQLKDLLIEWIDGLRYATDEIDWSEALWGEENKMAREFWPTGEEPRTGVVTVEADGSMSAETPGTVFRYSKNTHEERDVCEHIGIDNKANIVEMEPYNNGMDVVEYTSTRNGRSYMGYHFTPEKAPVEFNMFLGAVVGCEVFIASDGTFMESLCPTWAPQAFDTRDGMWNGETQTWDGVDAETGEWLIEPVTVYDKEAQNWRFDVLGPYFFGDNRNEVYSGFNPDGSPFIHTVAPDNPMNYGFNPAPKYWVSDEDPFKIPVAFSKEEAFIFKGWDLTYGSYEAVDNPKIDNKGSFHWGIDTRFSGITNESNFDLTFHSFDFECLFWKVGTEVDLESDEDLYVFTQGVRKGYTDSFIKEHVFSN